jgi:alpha-L-fucosidase 2
MDPEIRRDLFAATTDAAGILRVDPELRAEWTRTRARLAPLQIGGSGQLQEWLEDWDMRAPEMQHRHVSHLYGLFPGRDIDVIRTPALAAAVKRSLEIRGDQATGWATAWRINLWARLGDGDHAFRILEFLLGPGRTYPDMFDAHPPFQIDGNFGGASAVAEMLLQSEDGELRLLPALPKAWPEGRVTGLRARGGFGVDLTWRAGALQTAVITSDLGQPLRVRRGQTVRTIETYKGGRYTLTGDALR